MAKKWNDGMFDSESIDKLLEKEQTFYEFAHDGETPVDGGLTKPDAIVYEAMTYTRLRNSTFYESDKLVNMGDEFDMASLLYRSFKLLDEMYKGLERSPTAMHLQSCPDVLSVNR